MNFRQAVDEIIKLKRELAIVKTKNQSINFGIASSNKIKNNTTIHLKNNEEVIKSKIIFGEGSKIKLDEGSKIKLV